VDSLLHAARQGGGRPPVQGTSQGKANPSLGECRATASWVRNQRSPKCERPAASRRRCIMRSGCAVSFSVVPLNSTKVP
jgi:hypothetical protein